MIKPDEALHFFNDLSGELSRAIKSEDYGSAKTIAKKQKLFVSKFAQLNTNKSSLNLDEEWKNALEKHQYLIKTVENNMRELNSKTKSSLKRLKGYAN